MIKAAGGLSRSLFLGFIIGFTFLSARADQPPEILYATSPYSAILNLGATNSALLANASVCDAAGNFYVTGSFEGIAKFGTNSLSSNGGFNFDDIYVVKYDPAGSVLWAKRAGGSGTDYGRAITLDGAGGIYVAGTSDSLPCTIGTNTIGNYGTDMFIARYDGNGNVLWAQRGGPWLKNFSVQGGVLNVKGIARDSANNVIIAGSFTGNPSFGGSLNGQSGSDATYLTNHNPSLPTAYQDTYLAKFDASGSLLWAINPGGPDDDYANALAVDSTGAIYTSGGFNHTNILGGQTYTNSFEGMFLAKFSGAGNLVWSSNLSNATNSNPGHGLALTIDANDRVTLGLQANNSSQPFSFRGSNYALAFGNVNLLAQFDVNGNLIWMKQIPLNIGSSTLAVDKQNNIYLGGSTAVLKFNTNGVPLWTNSVPQLGLSAASVDDAGITHVSTTVVGDVGAYFTVGWTNIYPGFGGFGKDAIMFAIASNFVAVPPIFLQQPTNMVYQPPKGLTNSALARAWPAPRYFWYINNSKIPSQTNFFLALGPTTFTNQTTYFVVATNTYGSATSIVVNAQAALSFAPAPPTNIYVLVGTTLAISGGATGTSPATYQWQFKGTNIANAASATLALPNIALNQGGSYTLVLSNASTVITSTPPTLVTVLPIGSIDPSYTNNFTTPVSSLSRLPDGSYLVANNYAIYHVSTNGLLATNGLVVYPYRWNDGSSADQYLGPVFVLRQPDDKIIVAGNFKVYYTNSTTFTNASRIARLNPNGTLDTTFNVGVGPLNTFDGTNFTKIQTVLQLPNGQYLVGGTFNKFNGLARTNLARLNSDGSLDPTFTSGAFDRSGSPSQPGIHCLALQADGKILVGGQFDGAFGTPNPNFTRLNTNGTVDATFNQTTLYGFSGVNTILALPDGKILIGGGLNFSSPANYGAVRFNADGSRDTSWLGVLPGEVDALILTASNKFIFGGNGFVRRTTYDGINDTNFNNSTATFFSGQITYAVVQEPSGNVMVGGYSYGMRRLLAETIFVVPTFASGAGASVVAGHFQISACGGVDGQNVVVQASTDLVNWANVSTNVVSGGCISYTDTQAPPLPSRYYRLTVLP